MGDFENAPRRSRSGEQTTTTNSGDFRPTSPPDDAESNDMGTTLYVSNLASHLRADDIRSRFGRFGSIVECRTINNPVTKESRGFGFVSFESPSDSDKAMKAMDGKDIDGKHICVEKAKRARPHEPTPGQYKGPTGQSIKYDHRGRLKQGFVPYWELGPPRDEDVHGSRAERTPERRTRPHRDEYERYEPRFPSRYDDHYRMRMGYGYDGPHGERFFDPYYYHHHDQYMQDVEFYRRMYPPPRMQYERSPMRMPDRPPPGRYDRGARVRSRSRERHHRTPSPGRYREDYNRRRL